MKTKTILIIAGVVAVGGIGIIGYRRGWFSKSSSLANVNTKELKVSAQGGSVKGTSGKIPIGNCPQYDEQGRKCNGQWLRNPRTGKCYCTGERVFE